MPLRIAIRTDASLEIGSGHVFRCLVLATALRKAGHSVSFVCRALDGNLARHIRTCGHDVTLLRSTRGMSPPRTPAHAHWLPVTQEEDAAQFLAAIEGSRLDWIIVDHYALDITWETAVRPFCNAVMVIDDLADRRHDSDLLLDQNLGRRVEDYAGLLPAAARRLIGPSFALLAPRFRELRAASLGRRGTGSLGRILITMGGVDGDNVTGRVIRLLRDHTPSGLRHLDVVMGHAAPHVADVGTELKALSLSHSLHVNTTKMAELMCAADLAIGAGGSTSWERCCLGVPSLMVRLARNQHAVIAALTAAGAAVDLGDPTDDCFDDRLLEAFEWTKSPERLIALSMAARGVCDGKGAARVIDEMALQL